MSQVGGPGLPITPPPVPPEPAAPALLPPAPPPAVPGAPPAPLAPPMPPAPELSFFWSTIVPVSAELCGVSVNWLRATQYEYFGSGALPAMLSTLPDSL